MFASFGASRIVGSPGGSDVKSFSSPLFFNGAKMSNAARSGVVSQAIGSFVSAVGNGMGSFIGTYTVAPGKTLNFGTGQAQTSSGGNK